MNTEQINAGHMIASVMGGVVSGSVLVTPVEANDIDIFISYSQFRLYLHTQKLYGTPYEFPYTYNGKTMTFTSEAWASSEEYQANNKDDALVITYRSVPRGKINLIVVNDEFVPAFQWSAWEMQRNPHLYTERPARIKLHHDWRNWLRMMQYVGGVAPSTEGVNELQALSFL